MNAMVLNKQERQETILKLTLNLLPSQCRLDTLEGQEHTVVPMVILTEGVHAGSLGPLYYSKKELSKTPAVWNHKPVVVYHPTMNGVGVSACDPVIINSRKVGVMMNTRYDNGKLKSEAWIRKDRADAVDERIMSAVNQGEMMELSTGVFVDIEEKDGEYGGESYKGIARNFRPDHLALLPDQIGACSIADGAGFLRNAAHQKNIPFEVLRKALAKLGLADNELSHSDIHVALGDALRTRLGSTVGIGEPAGIWVMDVFSNFVIYEKDGMLFRLGYTSNDTEVQLSDETPVEVQKVSEYRTVQNSTEEQNIMNKEQMIAAIVGNAKWSDKDLETLNAMSDEQLKTLADLKKTNPAFEVTLSKSEEPVKNAKKEETPKVEKPVANAKEGAPVASAKEEKPEPKKVITVAEFIGNAPAEVQEVLNESLSMMNEEKSKIVAAILANEANSFTENELKTRPLGELRKIAQLMGAKSVPSGRPTNYAGQAPTPAENAEREEALEMPALNFDKR